MTFGERIKRRRVEMQYTQKEVSELTGIPTRTLQDWEAEKHTPPLYIQRMVEYALFSIANLTEEGKGLIKNDIKQLTNSG